MRIARVTLALIVAAAACGGDDGEETTTAGRSCLDDVPAIEEVIEITIAPPTGPLDTERAQALLARFNDSQDRIRVGVHDPGWPPERKVVELFEGTSADIVPVSDLSVPAVAEAGLAARPPACVLDDFDQLTDVGRARAAVSGKAWALPLGSSAFFLLYEREAFEAAGLDPDRPPGTVADLLTAARRLKDAGYDRPLVTGVPGHPLADTDPFADPTDVVTTSGPTAEMLDTLRTMVAEGLLWRDPPEGTPDGIPAIGTDEVAMEIGDTGLIWGIGTALAEGQAPGVTIEVAGVPGHKDPQSTAFGDSLVVAAASSPEEQAAAWAFVQWVSRPEQQADVHLFSDLLPTHPEAVETAAVKEYWQEVPLFRQAWDVLQEHGRVTTYGSGLPGWVYGGSIEHAADDVMFNGADPATRFDQAELEIAQRRDAFEQDPEAFFDCRLDGDAAACERLGLPPPPPPEDD